MAAPYSPLPRSSAPRWNSTSGASAKARAGSRPAPRRPTAKAIAGPARALGRGMPVHAESPELRDEGPGPRSEILPRARPARIEADGLARGQRLAGAIAERPVEPPRFERTGKIVEQHAARLD